MRRFANFYDIDNSGSGRDFGQFFDLNRFLLVNACVIEQSGLIIDHTIFVVVKPDGGRIAANNTDLSTIRRIQPWKISM